MGQKGGSEILGCLRLAEKKRSSRKEEKPTLHPELCVGATSWAESGLRGSHGTQHSPFIKQTEERS